MVFGSIVGSASYYICPPRDSTLPLQQSYHSIPSFLPFFSLLPSFALVHLRETHRKKETIQKTKSPKQKNTKTRGWGLQYFEILIEPPPPHP